MNCSHASAILRNSVLIMLMCTQLTNGEELFPVTVPDGTVFYTLSGHKSIVLAGYSAAGQFQYGRALVMEDSTQLWGFIDTSGELVIRPQFAQVEGEGFSCGLAADQKIVDRSYLFIDINGRQAISDSVAFA